MSTPETRSGTQELMREYLNPSGELAKLLRGGYKWTQEHPVAAARAYTLINSLPTQPQDRRIRIVELVERLYSRR